jgi:hypothetical protein
MLLEAFRTRIASLASEHRLIARGMLQVLIFVAIGKLAGAAKEIALAYRFGVGDLTDAYVTTLTFVMWPVAVWLTALTAILIPLESREADPKEIARFRGELFGATLLLGAATLLFAGIAVVVLGGPTSAFSQMPQFESVFGMLRIGIWLIPLGFVIGLGSVLTLGSGRHINTLLEGVPSLSIAVAIGLFPGMGASGLISATVLGCAVHLACLYLPLWLRGDLRLPLIHWRSSLWRPFFRGFSLLIAGQALMASVVLFDQATAIGLGPGAPSTLSYSNRVLAFVMGLCALSVTRSTLPVFSSAAATDSARFGKIAGSWSAGMFMVGIVLAAISMWLAQPAVALLFERGAFTHEDTQRVAEVLLAALPQLPIFLAGLVLSSAASSRGWYGLIFLACTGALLSKLLWNAIVVPHWGVAGLAFGWTFMYAVHAGILIAGIAQDRARSA